MWLLIYFVLISKALAKQTITCQNILCSAGYECDETLLDCVPVSCAAEEFGVSLCTEGYECIEDPEIDCNGEFPCKRYRCTGVCSPQCENNELCLPNNCSPMKEDCTFFKCQNRCSSLVCPNGYECDPNTLESDPCVAISCEANTACNDGYDCISENNVCDTMPCPQFICREQEPNLQVDGCYTECGVEKPSWSIFQNDGELYCKECTCLFHNISFCFPFDQCKADKVKSTCKEMGYSCQTTCGKDVTGSFIDDGHNFCNSCVCNKDGSRSCTKKSCYGLPEYPNSVCFPEEATCTTSCGKKVGVGITFKDDGFNYCNTCTCIGLNNMSCTEKKCRENRECEDMTDLSCKTSCDKVVPAGLRFKDDGNNYCNWCKCRGESKTCSRRGCGVGQKCT